MIFKNQITEEKLPNSIKFEKSHGNLVIEFDDNKTRFKIENYTYGSKTNKSEFTLDIDDGFKLYKLFAPKIHLIEWNNLHKELNEKENMLNELFAYFHDQIKSEDQKQIESVDELIKYYENNMIVEQKYKG